MRAGRKAHRMKPESDISKLAKKQLQRGLQDLIV